MILQTKQYRLTMKLTILLFVLILSAINSFSQEQKNGFAHGGAYTLLVKDFDHKAALNAGIGFKAGSYFSAGISFDLCIFKDPKFVIPKADFRIYPVRNDKEINPFVALQPGYVLYNQNNTKGSAAIDLLAGVMARPVKKKGIGLSLAAGYSKFGFKHKSASAVYTDAFK